MRPDFQLRWRIVGACCAFAFAVLTSAPACANIVNIDLSLANTGTLINAPGGSFASIFAGQTIVGGTGISGSPTNPLTLAPTNTLDVEFWNPVVSPASNSILPEPGNQGPLSILLASTADSITWTMGSASSPGPITVDFFNSQGALTGSVSQTLNPGYDVYTFSGVGDFTGLTIFNDTDPFGLRFMNFSYNTAAVAPGPVVGAGLPGAALAFAAVGFAAYRRRNAKHGAPAASA